MKKLLHKLIERVALRFGPGPSCDWVQERLPEFVEWELPARGFYAMVGISVLAYFGQHLNMSNMQKKYCKREIETQFRKFDCHRDWMISSVVLAIVALVLAVPLIAEKSTAQHSDGIRELRGRELQKANAARDAADRMRAEFEARYSWQPSDMRSKKSPPASSVAQEDAARVEAAYKAVMDKYASTEIAAYCGLRLSGLYKYRGNRTRAVDQAKEVADRFAGTSYEAKAYFTVGLICLQSLHNPREAAEWFKKIPKPNAHGTGDNQYDETEKLYLSAQQQIAKCELAMGKRAYANRRYERLSSRYPQFQKDIEQTRGSESRIDMERRAGFDPTSIFNERIGMDPLFNGEVLEPVAVIDLTNDPLQSPEDPRSNEITAAAQVSVESRASAKTRFTWAGVGSLCFGTGLCALGLFQCFYLPNVKFRKGV